MPAGLHLIVYAERAACLELRGDRRLKLTTGDIHAAQLLWLQFLVRVQSTDAYACPILSESEQSGCRDHSYRQKTGLIYLLGSLIR